MDSMRLCVIGTGYVGLVTAACFAELGHQVVAIDKNPEIIARLTAGQATVYEPGLQELLQRHLATGRLRFVAGADHAADADIIFVCVGTPSQRDGRADLTQVEEVARTLAPLLDGYKLIVEKSTVPVNTAKEIEATLHRFAPTSVVFDVASNPEFLREGSAIQDFLHPDRVVIGADSDRARALLSRLYEGFTVPVIITDVRTAELIKHAANAFLATKISFINLVADLCEAVGVDVTAVAKGIGLDRRIGAAFLNAGLGFGGSCFPKDLKALIRIGDELGTDLRLLREVERINDRRVDRFLKKVERALWIVRDKTIAVLGVAFKPNTDDIREAPSLRVIPALRRAGAVLRIYDPKAATNLGRLHPADDRLTYAASPYAAAEGAHALLVLTEWEEFRALDLDRLRDVMVTPILIDGRDVFDAAHATEKGFEFYSLGRGEVPGPVRVAGD